MDEPRNPTDEEFEGISAAITGDPGALDPEFYVTAVFDLGGGEKVALLADWPWGQKSYVLTFDTHRSYWVIRSIGEPTQT